MKKDVSDTLNGLLMMRDASKDAVSVINQLVKENERKDEQILGLQVDMALLQDKLKPVKQAMNAESQLIIKLKADLEKLANQMLENKEAALKTATLLRDLYEKNTKLEEEKEGLQAKIKELNDYIAFRAGR